MKHVWTSPGLVASVAKDLANECRGTLSPVLFDERDKRGFRLAYHIYDSRGKLYASLSVDDRVTDVLRDEPAERPGSVPFRSVAVGSLFMLNGMYYEKRSDVTYYGIYHRKLYTAKNVDTLVQMA